jgi:hypothetical protein
MELEREHPGVKQSMLKALGNVAPRHLLDTRLNPPGDLRARVQLKAESADEVRLKPDTTDEPDKSVVDESDEFVIDEPPTKTGACRPLTVFR